jgi:hypothetical protein
MKRLNLHIQDEAHDRLYCYGFATGREPGRILEELILAHVKQWVLLEEPDVSVDRTAGGEPASPARNPAPVGVAWRRLNPM